MEDPVRLSAPWLTFNWLSPSKGVVYVSYMFRKIFSMEPSKVSVSTVRVRHSGIESCNLVQEGAQQQLIRTRPLLVVDLEGLAEERLSIVTDIFWGRRFS